MQRMRISPKRLVHSRSRCSSAHCRRQGGTDTKRPTLDLRHHTLLAKPSPARPPLWLHQPGYSDSHTPLSRPTVPSSDLVPMPPKHIAIIGGGLTGLSSAFHLSRRFPSSRITLVEKAQRLGGWVHSERVQVNLGGASSASVLLESGPRTLRPNSLAVLELVSVFPLDGYILKCCRLFSCSCFHGLIIYVGYFRRKVTSVALLFHSQGSFMWSASLSTIVQGLRTHSESPVYENVSCS